MSENKNVFEVAEELQDECHKFIDDLQIRLSKKGRDFNYRDGQAVWLFRKLADIIVRIEELERSKNSKTYQP